MNTAIHPNASGELITLKYEGKIIAKLDNVELIQDGKSYAVRYGLLLRSRLTRAQACLEFGQCVYHQSQLNQPQ